MRETKRGGPLCPKPAEFRIQDKCTSWLPCRGLEHPAARPGSSLRQLYCQILSEGSRAPRPLLICKPVRISLPCKLTLRRVAQDKLKKKLKPWSWPCSQEKQQPGQQDHVLSMRCCSIRSNRSPPGENPACPMRAASCESVNEQDAVMMTSSKWLNRVEATSARTFRRKHTLR